MSDRQTVSPAPNGLRGIVTLPGDKSISHRAALFAALADGTSTITNFSPAADPASTLSCLAALGVEIGQDDMTVWIKGRGLHGFRAPDGLLDAGNSGTTLRLLSAILAGQPFTTTISGDRSLNGRPMRRIMAPLAAMGAEIRGTERDTPPLTITGRPPLAPLTYELPVPSAQVKSAVLLAGLYASGTTTVIEPIPSRDHTERMLNLPVGTDAGGRRTISVEGGWTPPAQAYMIPADLSAAAFLLVAGSVVPGSEISLPAVGLNPTRAGVLAVLRQMGADIETQNERTVAGEPIADLVVRHAPLTGIEIPTELVPNVIDELPILSVAAACASGTTTVRGADELRHKETDRIAAVVATLRALSVQIEEHPDGFTITGGRPLVGDGVELPSYGDHRIAMSAAVAGLVARGGVQITDPAAADISFPGFYATLDRLRS